MPRAGARKKKPVSQAAARLLPGPGEVVVRMYRIGHGDCFLLAFEGDAPDSPVYVLIDCGYKPGSSKFIHKKEEDATGTAISANAARDITRDIKEATGGHIDVAVITHEHQDHVNGITARNFDGISIGETWFAWTEDPRDDLANGLRVRFKDQLLGLAAARNRLAASGDPALQRIDRLIEFELGGDSETFDADAAVRAFGAAGTPANSANKQSMKLFKDLARQQRGVKYLRPHDGVLTIPRAAGPRVFVLGPPRNEALLDSLDPEGEEEFHGVARALSSAGSYFAAAAEGGASGGDSPFAKRYGVDMDEAFADPQHGAFFTERYGTDAAGGAASPQAPEWRRIDKDWLMSAEQLALDMNDATNNASLVLAFELRKGGKVLLFAADAQRGNWLSWGRKDWRDGDDVVTARELLSRVVLYKAGHHCSHNATLNGRADDDWPNLSWMALGAAAREFAAMITAVRAWAELQNGWDHPRKEIKDALLKKASGRLFQTDTALSAMKQEFAAVSPDGAATADWSDFDRRVTEHRLYFDYRISV